MPGLSNFAVRLEKLPVETLSLAEFILSRFQAAAFA